MSKARAETASGGRKLSEAHRAKLSATNRAKWAAMTPAERAAQLARIGRTPKSAGGPPSSADPPRSPALPPAGGRVNPLAMTPLELVRHLRQRGQEPTAE